LTYLITGAGTLSRALIPVLLARPTTARIIVVSRGEHRQAELRSAFPDPRLETWVGDVRDRSRMSEAMRVRPDVVIHGAALKRVEVCEAEPEEAHKTNVRGTLNVVKAALRASVPKVMVVSSDKACSPETVYGATKAQAEALALAINGHRGDRPTRISVVRYGNILGSAGSFLHTILRARETGETLSITDPHATRFWWAVEDAARFILQMIDRMEGAEIFVPKLVSARVVDLVKAVAPDAPVQAVGMRGPEKRHEAMINATEAPFTYELPECYVLLPKLGQWWSAGVPDGAVKVPAGFSYSSDQQPTTVSVCI
jgi:UDP-N-acetylglucosamine 4,6-dehydratase